MVYYSIVDFRPTGVAVRAGGEGECAAPAVGEHTGAGNGSRQDLHRRAVVNQDGVIRN